MSFTRRELLRLATGSFAGISASGWLSALAARAAHDPLRQRSCILLWMPGGPSQLDTFDPKPDHVNGGPIKSIGTAVPGIRIVLNWFELLQERVPTGR